MLAPAKLTVGELARRVGVSSDSIRYYTKKGLLSPCRDPQNGYRLYSESDVKIVYGILLAKRFGFTIGDFSSLISESRQGRSPHALAIRIIRARVAENHRNMTALRERLVRMEAALAQWESIPGEAHGIDSICELFETLGQ